jgi:hypothetical protein
MIGNRRIKAKSPAAGVTSVFIASALALLVAACGVSRGELEAAGTFGKSASALADSVKTAYAQGAQDDADLRAARYALKGGSYESQQQRRLVQFKGRIAAANVLGSYGQALSKLLDSKSQDAEVAAATDKLAASLKGLPKSTLAQTGIGAAEIDSAGKILTVFVQFYLDHKRREVLQQIVPAVEPIVTRLCGMFQSDFDVDRVGFAQVYFNEADRVLSAGPAEADARAAVVPLMQRVDAIRAKTTISFGTVKEAAASCAKSSQALRKAVEDPTVSYEDILDFANKAEAAYSVIQSALIRR